VKPLDLSRRAAPLRAPAMIRALAVAGLATIALAIAQRPSHAQSMGPTPAQAPKSGQTAQPGPAAKSGSGPTVPTVKPGESAKPAGELASPKDAAAAKPAAKGADKPSDKSGAEPMIAEGFEMGELDARSIPLGGALSADEPLWQGWKRRFLTDQGRVVDTANGAMSHSEGQGYGMLLAVAANDRVAFERIWGWTRANLMSRPDELAAWRWEPDKRSGQGDTNNATDGDILIAWALTEAAEFWADQSYRVAGRRIAVELSRKTFLLKTAYGTIILPAVEGFTGEERPDGPVVNLSYWVFPALERLKLVAPEVDWKGVTQSGLDLLKLARFGDKKLPADWISLKDKKPALAQGFPPTFGYNALRVPLYMAFAGIGERDHYAPFVALWRGKSANATIDLAGGSAGETMSEPGYRAVAALTLCAALGQPFPVDLKSVDAQEHYYPATLRLLALAGARMRYPSCLSN
jgi:endoglucanase